MSQLKLSLLRAIGMLLSVMLTACNSDRLAYNHLDTLIRWQLGDYVELTPPQRERFDREFQSLWAWHRHTQLPLYAKDLRELAQVVNAGLSTEQLQAQIDRVDAHVQALIDKALPPVAALLASLDDAQLALIAAGLDKDLAKEQKRVAKLTALLPDKQLAKRLTKAEEGISDWIGPLDDAQVARIKTSIAAMKRDPARINALSAARSASFIELLKQRHDPDFAAKLSDYVKDQSLPGFEDAQTMIDANQRASMQLMSNLSFTLTPQQREHLQRRLLDYAEDCEALSNEAVHTP